MTDDKYFSLSYPTLNSQFSNVDITRYSVPRLNRVINNLSVIDLSTRYLKAASLLRP